jgi:hypothetical protein
MGLKEKIVNSEVHHNPEIIPYRERLSWEYMNLFSFYTLVFSSFGLVYEYLFNDLATKISIYIGNQELMTNLFIYSVMLAVGQAFLYQILEKQGPLALSMITGSRKIFSIAISIFLFGKSVSAVKVISLVLGSTVIVWEILEKSKKSHGHHAVTAKSAPNDMKDSAVKNK